MPPRTASRSETYRPYLTDATRNDRGVDVAREPLPVKGTPPDLQRAIARIHHLGLHLVSARELRDATGGQS